MPIWFESDHLKVKANAMIKKIVLMAGIVPLLFAAGPSQEYLQMKKKAFYAYEHGKTQEALERVKVFIGTHPQSLYAQNLLATLYYWNGDKAQAKTILEKIVAKSNFPQARRLLARIGTGEREHSVQSNKHSENKNETKNKREDDLAFMQNYILTHPFDVDSRKVLLHYYLSRNDKADAARIAGELLHLNPDDTQTLALVRHENLKIVNETADVAANERRDKVVALLHSYKEQHAYRRYLNLYQAMVDQQAYLPAYIHLEALEVAIMLHKYSIARRILLQNDFPATPHLRELRALLDRKLKVASAL